MTKEEAIKILEMFLYKQCSLSRTAFAYTDIEIWDAVNMATEALKAPTENTNAPTDTPTDFIRRQDAIDAICKDWCNSKYKDCKTPFNQETDEYYHCDGCGDIETLLALPSAEPKTDEENELKFYYVESIDDYWIGQRLDNFYYADWHDGLGFVWSHSRYLPWGEHIVDENTLWKEHTYPSEPIELPFTEWIVGFVKKYFAEPKTRWIPVSERLPDKEERVLVTVLGYVEVAWRDRYGIWQSAEDTYKKGDVTAWRPLPEPYKAESEDKE